MNFPNTPKLVFVDINTCLRLPNRIEQNLTQNLVNTYRLVHLFLQREPSAVRAVQFNMPRRQ